MNKFKRSLFLSVASIFVFSLASIVNAEAPANYRWVQHIKGITAGDIAGIAVDPTNNSTVYALTTTSGVYKSTDGGNNWTAVNSGLPSDKTTKWSDLASNLLTMDPNNSQVLYAAFSGKIYKTANGGTSWSDASSGTEVTIGYSTAGIAADPAHSNTFYSATIVDNSSGGAFKTTNGGSSWTQIAGALLGGGTVGGYGGNDAWSYVVDPSDSSKQYFSAVHLESYKSTDGGVNWTHYTVPANFSSQGSMAQTMIIHPTNHHIFASYSNGLITSTDYAQTWTEISTFTGKNVKAVQFAPSNPAIMYAVTFNGEIYKSVDTGDTWTLQSSDSTIQWRSIAIDPTDPTILYLGSAGKGMYKSTNSGVWFSPINNGINASPTFYDIANQNTSNPNILYIKAVGVGLFRSTDGGYTWNFRSPILSGVTVASDPTNPDVVFTNDSGNNLLRSTDGGLTWTNTGGASSTPWRSVVFAPTDHNIVWAKDDGFSTLGNTKVLKSTDNGVTWSLISFFNGKDLTLSNISINPSDANTVYIGSNTQYVYKTTDGGTTWIQLPYNLGSSSIFSTSVNPKNTQNVFVGTFNNNAEKYYRSTDGGSSFLQVFDFAPYNVTRPHEITYDKTNSSLLYGIAADISTGYAIKSTDSGVTWSALPTTGITNYLLDIKASKKNSGEILGLDQFSYFDLYENDIPKFDQSTYTAHNHNGSSTYFTGDTVDFTFVINNHGPATGTNPTVDITFPTGISYVANSIRIDGAPVSPDPIHGNDLTGSTQNLEYGDSSTITFQGVISVDAGGKSLDIPDVISSNEDPGTHISDVIVKVQSNN